MSIRTKFTIAAIGFFFPIGLLLYFFIITRNEKIIVAEKEIEGNAYLHRIRPLMCFVLRHKLLANRLASNTRDVPELRTELGATKDSIDKALEIIGLNAAHLGAKTPSAEKYSALAASWQALKSSFHHAGRFSEVESTDAHTSVMLHIHDLISYVGDQSNLILDPDLDSYYLMDLTLQQMPEREHLIYQITILGEHLLNGSSKNREEDKFLTTSYITLLKANIHNCRNDYRAAFAHNSAANLRPALEKVSERNLLTLQEFTDFAEKYLTRPDDRSGALSLPQLMEAHHRAVQASNDMWAAETKSLDVLLANRIETTKKELYINIGTVMFVLLLATVFSSLVLWAVVHSIRDLSAAAARVSNGDLNVQVVVRSSDELSDLGRVFNAMIESLQTSFTEVEQEQKESVRLAMEALLEIEEREKAEVALKQEKEKAEYYLRAAEVIFVAFDTEARITLLNRKGYQILEYEEGALVGQDWFKVCLPPEDYDAVSQAYKQIIAGEVQQFEYYENPILTQSGKKRYIAWHNSLLRDTSSSSSSGNITGVFSSGEDITERKQAEEALRASEERLRALSELSLEGIFIHENGIIWNANQALANFFGIPNPEYLIGKNSFDVLSFTPKSLEIIREQMRTNSNKINEIEAIRPDGSIFPAEIQGREIVYDGRRMRVVVARDITERKRIDDTLKRLVMMSDVALQLTQAGYWHSPLDNSGWYNSSAQTVAIFGDIPNAEFRYRVIEDWHCNALAGDEEYARASLQNYHDAITGNVEMYDSIYAYKRPIDGKVVWIRALGKVIRNEDGVATDMIGVSQDITKFKLAEERINELNRTLEQRVMLRTHELENANKELEAFSYSVSHDLRAPLRGIDGWSLALEEDYGEQLNATARQYLERVRSETQRMGQLIDDMLRLSVITRSEMKWTTVNLSTLASSILARLQETYPEREFTFLIQPDLVVSGDTNLLEIMLTNLLGNACKFTSNKPMATIEFGMAIANGKQAYFVRDNGAGFNMEAAKKLFGAFQRMHKQSEFPGTGIGLATVQRIINRHQGSVWVEAAINKGATFYFTLEQHFKT